MQERSQAERLSAAEGTSEAPQMEPKESPAASESSATKQQASHTGNVIPADVARLIDHEAGTPCVFSSLGFSSTQRFILDP